MAAAAFSVQANDSSPALRAARPCRRERCVERCCAPREAAEAITEDAIPASADTLAATGSVRPKGLGREAVGERGACSRSTIDASCGAKRSSGGFASGGGSPCRRVLAFLAIAADPKVETTRPAQVEMEVKICWRNAGDLHLETTRPAPYWRADVILCKTALCARYLRKWFRQEGNPRATRVVYTRHTTTNLALTLKSELSTSEAAALAAKNFSDVSFLHTAGKSMQKGTRQVLDCWLSQPEFPPLDFYVDRELYDGAFNDYEERIRDSGNVRLHTGGLSAEAFGRVIAQGRYFLCPSMMEGYGHYINQARSANAFIITTDAAPMNELITPSSGALVRARTGAYGEQFMGGVSSKEHALRNVSGLVAGFEKDDVCNTVVGVLKSSTAENREQRATRALQQYYFDTVFFAHKMKELRAFARAMSHPSLRGKILDNVRRI